MQYRTGLAEVQNGSNTITGYGTEWLTNVSVGDRFKLKGINCSFPITAVTADNELEIGVNWPFASSIHRKYQIQAKAANHIIHGYVSDEDAIYISKADGYAFIDLADYCTLALYDHKKLVLYYTGLWGYLKVMRELLDPVDPSGLRLGSLINSGALIIGALYLVISENDTGKLPPEGTYFNSTGTQTVDSENTVKQVIAPSQKGAFIVNTPNGTVYNWNSL